MEHTKMLQPLIQSVISDLMSRGYAPGTILQHQEIFGRLQEYCESNCVTEYSERVGQQFVKFLQDSNPTMSISTLHRYTGSIKRLNCVLDGIEWRQHGIKEKDYAASCYNKLVIEYENYLTSTGKQREYVRRHMLPTSGFLAFVEQSGCTQLNELTAEIILAGFNRATYKSGFRQFVGAFLQYAYNRKMTKSNLRHLIPNVVHHHGVPSVYSPEEVEQLLASIDRTTSTGKRDYAVTLIAARLGLRASDIANLQFDDFKAEKIEIIQAKTQQPLSTVLLNEIKEAVSNYVHHGRQQSSEAHIFLRKGGYGVISASNISKLIRRAFARSGIDFGKRKMGPHSLRASLATALLAEGNDYPTIQRVLGQRNIQSTKFYAKADIEQLRTHAIPVPPPSGNFAELLSKGV